jgi:hypothetical protein
MALCSRCSCCCCCCCCCCCLSSDAAPWPCLSSPAFFPLPCYTRFHTDKPCSGILVTAKKSKSASRIHKFFSERHKDLHKVHPLTHHPSPITPSPTTHHPSPITITHPRSTCVLCVVTCLCLRATPRNNRAIRLWRRRRARPLPTDRARDCATTLCPPPRESSPARGAGCSLLEMWMTRRGK